jgi:hypothetical protein
MIEFYVCPHISTYISSITGNYCSSTSVGLIGSMNGEGMESMSITPSG